MTANDAAFVAGEAFAVIAVYAGLTIAFAGLAYFVMWAASAARKSYRLRRASYSRRVRLNTKRKRRKYGRPEFE